MKKLIIFITFTLSGYSAFSQENDFQTLLDSGKVAFKNQFDQEVPDYSRALNLLTKAVKLRPNHTEARYFLGYTLDKINAGDGSSMPQSQKVLIIQASEQFEMINKIEEQYTGEVIALDPNTKIGTLWGCLAQAYLTRNLTDSAKWAFAEGKKRGGFIEPVLDYNRQLLNGCEKNGIVITSGDILTITCWYLQIMEQFRTDLTIVDAGLMNSIWYPRYMKNVQKLKLSIPDSEIDSIDYIPYKATRITITHPTDPTRKFSWTMKPTYYDQYILRGDRLMMDMVKQNIFSRNIYFTVPSDSSYNLFLDKSFLAAGLVSKVMLNRNELSTQFATATKNLAAYNIKTIGTYNINRSRDALRLINNIRWAYYSECKYLQSKGKNAAALKLIQGMEEKLDTKILPYEHPPLEGAFDELKEALSAVK